MEKQQQELAEFSKRWDGAMTRNDAEEIGQFMSDDWIIVGSDGITSRTSFLQSVATGLLMHNRMDAEETTIKIHGNTGILVSRGTSAGTYNGNPFSFYEWSTSVFINTDGKWLCIMTMLTPANAPA